MITDKAMVITETALTKLFFRISRNACLKYREIIYSQTGWGWIRPCFKYTALPPDLLISSLS